MERPQSCCGPKLHGFLDWRTNFLFYTDFCAANVELQWPVAAGLAKD